jgi:hypothetical protein
MKWNLRGEYIGDIEFVKDMELMLKIRYQVKGYCIALVLDSMVLARSFESHSQFISALFGR